MASLIIVRGIGFNKYVIINYALINLYILRKDRDCNLTKALIIREVYIVKGLKAKMLIKINIIRFKKINILVNFKKLSLKSCETTSPIKITFKKYIIKKAVHVRKSIIVLTRF